MKSFVTLVVLLGGMALSASAFAEDDAAKAKAIEIGKANFATCQACHGADGKGVAVGDKLMAPTFHQSKFILAKPEVSIAIVLKGIQKEGDAYVGMMAPLGAAFDDEKLAGVLTHVRNDFGNSASLVTAEQVKEVRAKLKDKTTPWTRAELEKMLAE